MRKLGVTLSTVLIIITAPVFVAAADLFTPLLVLDDTRGDLITCTVLNVSSRTLTVTVRLMDSSGQVSGTAFTTTLDPGQGTGFGQTASLIDFCYCQFTVNGPKGAIRAGAILKPGNTFHPAQ